jgi:exodeoxyribonuclease V alpha subunit
LAYAISGHKSQGSEWPIVLVMLDDYPGAKMVQSRQWLYTAVSRAKKLCLLIGRAATANEMCGRDALFRRKTFLRERILEHVESAAAAEQVVLMDRVLEGV